MKISDQLYELAYFFKKSALWDFVCDNETFAVKLSTDKTAYCSVLGRNGECFALNIYIGKSGWNSFLHLQYEPTSFAEEQEFLFMQDCLQVSFDSKENLQPEQYKQLQKYAKEHNIKLGKDNYANFLKFEKRHIPWPTSKASDFKIMEECLKAALHVSQQLLLKKFSIKPFYKTGEIPLFTPKGDSYTKEMISVELKYKGKFAYPSTLKIPNLEIEKQRGTIYCDLIMLPMPIQEKKEAPKFPLALLTVNEDGMILSAAPLLSYDKSPEDFVLALIKVFQNQKKKPKTIVVRNERTFKLLYGFCLLNDIRVELGNMPLVDEAFQGLIESIRGSGNTPLFS